MIRPMKNPTPAAPVDPDDMRQAQDAAPDPRVLPVPRDPVPREPLRRANPDLSVAGEEDPGAALDVVSAAGQAAVTCPPGSAAAARIRA
jgi:hypothetical protein